MSGALDVARSAGALTIALVAVPESELGRLADHEIAVVVGPEVIAGSTRLKAGTAQKLVLNMISTISMVRLGKTYGNLMVDVVATNDKLRARVHRIVAQATGAERGPGRRGARGLRRRREGRDRLAARRHRRRRGAAAARRRRRRRAEGARAMRLGVQACLVDGRLEPGDVEVEDGVVVGDRPRGRQPGRRDPGLRRPAGQRLRGHRLPRRRRGRVPRGRRRAARDRGDRVPADVHHLERGRPRHRAALGAARGAGSRPARARGAPRRPVPLGEPARHPPGPLSLRSRPGPARAARSPPVPVRMMTLAPELPGALELDRRAPGPGNRRLPRPLERDRGRGARRLRSRRPHGHPRLQRDAAADASRPRHRRRGARAAGRRAAGDRRRRAPRP